MPPGGSEQRDFSCEESHGVVYDPTACLEQAGWGGTLFFFGGCAGGPRRATARPRRGEASALGQRGRRRQLAEHRQPGGCLARGPSTGACRRLISAPDGRQLRAAARCHVGARQPRAADLCADKPDVAATNARRAGLRETLAQAPRLGPRGHPGARYGCGRLGLQFNGLSLLGAVLAVASRGDACAEWLCIAVRRAPVRGLRARALGPGAAARGPRACQGIRGLARRLVLLAPGPRHAPLGAACGVRRRLARLGRAARSGPGRGRGRGGGLRVAAAAGPLAGRGAGAGRLRRRRAGGPRGVSAVRGRAPGIGIEAARAVVP
mmetsp:Transcript_63859/g.207529  ORF Transcript_63859/g.207529 Transcript_63859/m.207529 type:complete len:321 (-) Transcript_63859:2429-3391(-)